VFAIEGSRSARLSSVVLPLPRKPVRMVTGVCDKLGVLTAKPADPASRYIYENTAGTFILPRSNHPPSHSGGGGAPTGPARSGRRDDRFRAPVGAHGDAVCFRQGKIRGSACPLHRACARSPSPALRAWADKHPAAHRPRRVRQNTFAPRQRPRRIPHIGHAHAKGPFPDWRARCRGRARHCARRVCHSPYFAMAHLFGHGIHGADCCGPVHRRHVDLTKPPAAEKIGPQRVCFALRP
jgi:hypothetical protein